MYENPRKQQYNWNKSSFGAYQELLFFLSATRVRGALYISPGAIGALSTALAFLETVLDFRISFTLPNVKQVDWLSDASSAHTFLKLINER